MRRSTIRRSPGSPGRPDGAANDPGRAPAPSLDGTLIERYDSLLVDLDGVVHRGGELLAGAAEALTEARRHHRRIVFLTNNSSKTPEQVAAELAGLGVAASPEEVLTSAEATAAMLRREGFSGGTAFVIGEEGVRTALASSGIELLDVDAERSDLVVVGWDRSLDYRKLRTAALLLQRGARLVATNDDASYPARGGLWPGAGATLAAVTTATGAEPTVVGKPWPPMFQAARERAGSARPLVVGDRLETDIAGAAGMGWDSLLVLTGVAAPPDLLKSPALPTYVERDLSILRESPPPGRFVEAMPKDDASIRDLMEEAGLAGPEQERDGACTLVCRAPGGVVATVTVERVDDSGLLRSLAVRKGLRGWGLGMLAVACAVRLAAEQHIRQLYLFTEGAAPFFKRLGFTPLARERVPEAVGRRAGADKACASATAMVLAI